MGVEQEQLKSRIILLGNESAGRPIRVFGEPMNLDELRAKRGATRAYLIRYLENCLDDVKSLEYRIERGLRLLRKTSNV